MLEAKRERGEVGASKAKVDRGEVCASRAVALVATFFLWRCEGGGGGRPIGRPTLSCPSADSSWCCFVFFFGLVGASRCAATTTRWRQVPAVRHDDAGGDGISTGRTTAATATRMGRRGGG